MAFKLTLMAFVQTMDQLQSVVCYIKQYQDCYQTIPSSNEFEFYIELVP